MTTAKTTSVVIELATTLNFCEYLFLSNASAEENCSYSLLLLFSSSTFYILLLQYFYSFLTIELKFLDQLRFQRTN